MPRHKAEAAPSLLISSGIFAVIRRCLIVTPGATPLRGRRQRQGGVLTARNSPLPTGIKQVANSGSAVTTAMNGAISSA